MDNFGAPIYSFEEFEAKRPEGRIVVTSGGFDPIHPGHISLLQESGNYGDVVVAVVNGDSFLRAKKGRPFQDLQTRCLIVSAISGVKFVVPDSPMHCVIKGTAAVLEQLGERQHLLIGQ